MMRAKWMNPFQIKDEENDQRNERVEHQHLRHRHSQFKFATFFQHLNLSFSVCPSLNWLPVFFTVNLQPRQLAGRHAWNTSHSVHIKQVLSLWFTKIFSQPERCQRANRLPVLSGMMLPRNTFWSSLFFKANLLSTGILSQRSSATVSLQVRSCK